MHWTRNIQPTPAPLRRWRCRPGSSSSQVIPSSNSAMHQKRNTSRTMPRTPAYHTIGNYRSIGKCSRKIGLLMASLRRGPACRTLVDLRTFQWPSVPGRRQPASSASVDASRSSDESPHREHLQARSNLGSANRFPTDPAHVELDLVWRIKQRQPSHGPSGCRADAYFVFPGRRGTGTGRQHQPPAIPFLDSSIQKRGVPLLNFADIPISPHAYWS
jgi:hypothetical protein